jgi:hypothetical protein
LEDIYVKKIIVNIISICINFFTYMFGCERTSMGDSYIVHTALLTVDGNEKTLTIAPAETSSDMQFWYYTDGSVKGDTKEVSQSSAVEIDGKKYDVAFEFPIKSDNEFVGVKFAASAMPLSPSARIKIDYDSAKKVGNVVKETTTKETTTVTTTVATTIEQSTTEQEELTASSESKSTNRSVIIAGVVAGVIIIGAVVGIAVKKKSN